MRGGRWIDLVVIVIVIAVGGLVFTRTSRDTPPAAQPSSPAAAPSGFELRTVDTDQLFRWDARSPAFLILTAMGCSDCRSSARAEKDRQAVALAHSAGLPAYHLYLYGDANTARAIVARNSSGADRLLFDGDGKIGVGQYRGSDDACWILLDNTGRVKWQGRPDLEALRARLPAPQGQDPTPRIPSAGAFIDDQVPGAGCLPSRQAFFARTR